MSNPRVLVVHDYLTQRGGAERVVLDMLNAYPGARLLTSFYDPASTFPEFRDHRVETLGINNVAALRRDPRRAMPFLAQAFGSHVERQADLVLCSSSGWSHRIVTRAPKIVYCHNPARWLYQPHEYLQRLSPVVRAQFVGVTGRLRRSDAAAAQSACRYLTNSHLVAARIRSTYGIAPSLVPPARGLNPDGPQQPIAGIEPGFLLTVARTRGYKHTDVVCRAMAQLPHERLVVVGGDPAGDGAGNITQVSGLSDAQLRWLYANSAGVIAVAHEDFGLIVPEAQGFGVPVVTLRAGGYLDTNVDGLTGVFVDEATPAAVAAGVAELRARHWDPVDIRRHGATYSKEAFTHRLHAAVDDALQVEPVDAPLAQVITFPHRPVPGALLRGVTHRQLSA